MPRKKQYNSRIPPEALERYLADKQSLVGTSWWSEPNFLFHCLEVSKGTALGMDFHIGPRTLHRIPVRDLLTDRNYYRHLGKTYWCEFGFLATETSSGRVFRILLDHRGRQFSLGCVYSSTGVLPDPCVRLVDIFRLTSDYTHTPPASPEYFLGQRASSLIYSTRIRAMSEDVEDDYAAFQRNYSQIDPEDFENLVLPTPLPTEALPEELQYISLTLEIPKAEPEEPSPEPKNLLDRLLDNP